MQEPNSDKPRQANTNVDQTRRPKTAWQKKLGAVGGLGRPINLPGWLTWPVGPTASTSQVSPPHPVAPCYKYKGGGVENWTHTHTPHLTHLLLCLYA